MRYLTKVPRKLFNKFKYSPSVAKNPLHSDIYIVEFPKSGITWLSTILANAFFDKYGIDRKVTFLNLRYIFPDIHISRDIGNSLSDLAGTRLIKSHSRKNPYYKSVIYLCRHPVDVMRSYYWFYSFRLKENMEMMEFVKNRKIGIEAWKDHINSWLNTRPTGNVMHFLKYEDLLKNPEFTISELSANFGWGFSEENVEVALNRSSQEEMKNSEEKFVTYDRRYEIGFVKRNKVEMPDKVRDYISSSAQQEMKLLGYESE